MKRILLFLILFFPFISNAQEYDVRNRIAVQVGFSFNKTIDFCAGYHHLFCKYVGLGGYVGAWSIKPKNGVILEKFKDKSRRQRGFIKPTLLFRTPTLFKAYKYGFHFEFEPGIMVSARQKMSLLLDENGAADDVDNIIEYKSKCISYHCEFSCGASYKNFDFFLCYTLSNLDINRKYNIENPHDYSRNKVHNIGFKMALLF